MHKQGHGDSETSTVAVSPPAERAGLVHVTEVTPGGQSTATSADYFEYSDQLQMSCAAPP